MLPYTVHVTLLCALCKLLEVLGRTTSGVSHHASLKQGKDKTEHCC